MGDQRVLGIDAPPPRPVFALDDAEADLVSLERAFRRLGRGHELRLCRTSADLFDELDKVVSGPSNSMPGYVLLDINLPDANGLDILARLRSQYPGLPVVMLSGSAHGGDKQLAYTLGASGFLSKPIGIDVLTEMLRVVDDYWQRVVSPPDRLTS